MSKPSVIFMGSKPGSVVALRAMIKRGWDIRQVVVTPNVQHPWIQGPSLEEVARDMGLAVVTQSELPRDPADFIISYMFRSLVKKDVIALGSRAAVNFHAAPLPEFGGWAFYNLAIYERSNEYGCTCHHMDEGFDTGPLLKVRRFAINPDAHTAVSLEQIAQQEMICLFHDFIDLAESSDALPNEIQEPSKMRYFRKEEFEKLKEIPNDADEEMIDRIARAFWYPPYECAWTRINGRRVQIVPECAKEEIASLYHRKALSNLQRIADEQELIRLGPNI